MKKNIVMIVAALMLGSFAVAQSAGPKGGAKGTGQGQGQRRGGPDGGPGRGMGMEKEIFAKLNLTAAQKQQLENLGKAQREKMKSIREKAQASGQKPNRDQMRAQFQKMQEEHKAAIKRILTTQQYQKFEQLIAQARKDWQKNHPNGPGRPGAPGAGKGK
ncbi:MAG: hypothetical protein JNM34_05235 [Chthonomonadaceae bacterium]|nr:hypothetical protein [Chthonomonadaceae bacterium]